MTDIVRTSAEKELRCPSCGDVFAHVDEVLVAAREEDSDFDEISVNAQTGQIRTHGETPAPAGRGGEGRRHRIALRGWCEICDANFALVFTQHKGVTFVEWSAEPGVSSAKPERL